MSSLSFPHSVRVRMGDKTSLVTKKTELFLSKLLVTYYRSKKVKSEGETSLLLLLLLTK